ncbi:protein of unknown function [Tranquillimonas alkanivorans]|uniref:DUF4112 domain-containing protein n=2 Tax=Tranquillimonas alkanivorans TaxID=441119 RepID=A0A1I5QLH0_9RHOB|nr:DUF4112 domain-containing protein [Tranquillimonas alkanivorans]SFP46891.1 protein of unknown function [Tranquillimonas alkanivorans]
MPYTSSRNAELERLERLADRMDAAFRIPVVGVRVGWDSILGLIPGIGDAAALAPASYIVYRAHRLGAPPPLLARMGVNVGVDALIGTIPLVGDLLDIGLKANRRNVALLRRHVEGRAAQEKRATQAGGPPLFDLQADQPTSSRPEKK